MTTIDPRFDTSEGGIGRYTATTVDAFFREGQYGWALHLKNALDEPELFPGVENGEFTEIFNLGSGWSALDGENATHTRGPQTKYNASSQIGVLLNGSKGKAYDAEGTAYNGLAGLPGYRDTIDAEWSAYVASSFKGLHAVWDQVSYPTRQMGKTPVLDANGAPMKDPEGRPVTSDTGVWEESSRTKRMPVELVGGTATTGTAPANNGQVDVPAMDPIMGAQVTAAAQVNDTYDGFLAAITPIEGAVTTLAGVLSNPANYPALRDALTA